MSSQYFKKMKKKEKAFNEKGELRLDEIVASGKYTHAMLKYDGTHIDLEIKLPDSIKMITREGNDVSHLVPYLVDDIRLRVLPRLKADITIACEAVNIGMNPKKTWSHSRSVLGRKVYDDTLDKLSLIVYDIYDCLDHLREPANYYYKRRTLYSLFKDSIFCGLPNQYSISRLEVIWNRYVEQLDFEGFVLYNEYMEDYGFTKLKPENVDIDCVVLGYHEGKKGTRLEGKLGAFEVGLYKPDGSLVSIGKVPTMTDVERVKWTERMKNWNNPDGYLDEPYVIQVRASEVLPSGKLRFPSYVREREDKRPEECLWEQLGI